MATRTFKQQGRGYFSNQVSVIARLDGNVIYSGPVSSIDMPCPTLPNMNFDSTETLFTWENTTEFSGQQQLEIEVTGGVLLLTHTVADYVDITDPGVFGSFYSYQDGEHTISDPLSDEKINGITLPEDRLTGDLYGQWWWQIPDGHVFTATLNVAAGTEAPQWDPSREYDASATQYVQNSGIIYQRLKVVPVGIDILDTEYWKQIYPGVES